MNCDGTNVQWNTIMTTKDDVVKFLQKNGVETRFVSIMDGKVYINNLRLSKFSRRKEEIFLEKFPDYEVRRSQVFQKICTRASRVLKTALNPHDKILLSDSPNCVNLILRTVLEPYTRKYGVELIIIPELDFSQMEVQNTDGKKQKVDAVALPFTMDEEVEHILGLMIHGEELKLLSSENQLNGPRMIYPLINVPISWIESMVEIETLNCIFKNENGHPREMLEFLESFIPDVREKMMRSADYLSGDK